MPPKAKGGGKAGTAGKKDGKDAKGKDDKDGKGEVKEESDPYVKMAQLKVIAIFLIVLVCPALGLWYRAWIDSIDCDNELAECKGECAHVYENVKMVFMSEGAGERACYRKCADEDGICMRTVNVLYMSGGLLCGSFLCSIGLVQLMLFLKSQKKIGSMEDLSARARPITHEPIFTEDELNDSEKKAMDNCQKWIFWLTCPCFGCKNAIRSMLMLIFQYYGVVPTPDPAHHKTAVKCTKCGMDFEADERWASNDRSGMKGVSCPRCYRRVLGLL